MKTPLDEFFAGHDWKVIERVNGWVVTRDEENPDIVRINLVASDGERYVVRCECSDYPREAPGVTFVNEAGSKNDATAWPAGDAEFDQIVKPPPNCFLCTSTTREGLQHHQDWRGDVAKNPWNGADHTLMDIFNLVSRLLTGPNYRSRKRV